MGLSGSYLVPGLGDPAVQVVRLTDTRLLITDLDENRFEIPDVLQLSQKEQRKLDLFL